MNYCLFASKQGLLFESHALFEGVNIIGMGVNIVRIRSGGLIAIFLVSEKKTAAMLENIAKANEEWKKIIDRQTEENNTLRSENITLQEKYHQQFDINTALRQEIDTKNTKIAVLSLLRCKKLRCIDREPPYGSGIVDLSDNDPTQNED